MTVSLIAVLSMSMVPEAHSGAPQARHSTSRRKQNGEEVALALQECHGNEWGRNEISSHRGVLVRPKER